MTTALTARINPALFVGAFVVVETFDGQAYLGTVYNTPDGPVLRTGLRGHPKPLVADEIAAITPALKHPDVVVAR